MSATLNIVADQQITLAAQVFEQFGHLRLVNGRDITRQMLQDTEVLLVRSVTPVNAAMLHDTPVRFVGSATAGIDHIDVSYLHHNNIEFVYAPGSNARSVAEYVLSSLLQLARRDSFELAGKSIGIIGVGEVGSRVKSLLEKLGMRCLLNDPPRAEHDDSEEWLPLQALTGADIITCHVPLTRDGKHPTYRFIDQQFLEQLKPNVILINTARGDVIDEDDLLNFIEKQPGARMVLDVWANEPHINAALLEQAEITTAHIAGYSYDGKLNATRELARALQAWTHIDNIAIAETESEQVTRLDNEQDAMYEAVMSAYDVTVDSNKLKQTLHLTATERGACFDKLRRDYPVRREFNQVAISMHGVSEQDKLRLQQLGFALDQS
ncbi:MAG: 4-phosphoerythronate dehydrogenase [Gammaproteobacteria bacterium]